MYEKTSFEKGPSNGAVAMRIVTVSAAGKQMDKKLDGHQTYEFGGPASMSPKSRFRMQMQGTYQRRWTFPQLPWGTIKNPSYIQTKHGNRLLTSGWWAFVRKPNYTGDWVQALTWGLVIGTASPIPYFYPFFSLCVLIHRCRRDFERCAAKYGADWVEYCKLVKWRFISGVYRFVRP